MKKILFLLASLCLCCSAIGQKAVNALRINDKISIDGKLDEPIWSKAETQSDFILWQPTAGGSPSQQTEVKFLYDDDAVYLGVWMPVEKREDIQTQLTSRDNVGNADWFGLVLDTYGNGTDAFEFILAATGVQFDAKLSDNGEDENWNAVWESEVTLHENGWYAELKIPYFSIRFPKNDVQNWKVIFLRYMAHTGEKSTHTFVDPNKQGFVNQATNVNGVKDIKAPLRLSLSPYITGYVSRVDDRAGYTSTDLSYSGGLDLKYGINEAFTLDMTLIPDFGQTRSDDRVLNLSPFEVQYSENRDFFTEGLELFNKGNIFYSRRVGGRPIGYYGVDYDADTEKIVSNPITSQLYNATKLSGRTSGGLGIGFFNSVSAETNAEIENIATGEKREVETSPLTNYNIVVLDQNLANNSYVSLINSNVYRAGDVYRSANVTATDFVIRNKAQSYSTNGIIRYSQLYYADKDQNANGLNYNLGLHKTSGHYRVSLSHSGISKNYTHNDLGFFTQSDVKGYELSLSKLNPDGWKMFNRINTWFNVSLGTTYHGNAHRFLHFNAGFWGQTKGFWNFNMWTNYRPKTIDYTEARTEGQIFRKPGFYNQGWYISSDYRKKLRVSMSLFGSKTFRADAYYYQLGLNPKYRLNDKFSIELSSQYSKRNNGLGFATFDDNDRPIIGLRDRLNIQNILSARYTFNNKMSAQIRARHNWSSVKYNKYFGLDTDGNLTSTEYNGKHNFEFNVFNIDLNYTWRFAPGSDLIFVWKQSILGTQDTNTDEYSNRSYFDGFNSLSNLPRQDNFSVRLVYFFNAGSIL